MVNKDGDFIKHFIFEKKFSLARHIAFWLVSYIFIIAISSQDSLFDDTLKTALIYLPFNILFAYVIIYVFVPKFLNKRKIHRFSYGVFYVDVSRYFFKFWHTILYTFSHARIARNSGKTSRRQFKNISHGGISCNEYNGVIRAANKSI